MVYSTLLPLMRTPRLPVVDWTDAPAVLNGLVRFAERRNLVPARVPSHFKRSLLLRHVESDTYCVWILRTRYWASYRLRLLCCWWQIMIRPVGVSSVLNWMWYVSISGGRRSTDRSRHHATGHCPCSQRVTLSVKWECTYTCYYRAS